MSGAKRATFLLSEEILGELDKCVAAGVAPNRNALVERALRREIKAVQAERHRAGGDAVALDPLAVKAAE